MKHYVKPECKFKCRFLQITPGLWLCPHAAYGEASYYKGMVADGRALLDKWGGYEAVLAGIVEAEEAKKEVAKEERAERQKNPVASEQVRYG